MINQHDFESVAGLIDAGLVVGTFEGTGSWGKTPSTLPDGVRRAIRRVAHYCINEMERDSAEQDDEERRGELPEWGDTRADNLELADKARRVLASLEGW